MSLKKKILIGIGVVIVIGIIVALSMFFKPARDVQATETDFKMNASELVEEYLNDADISNLKYLDEAGNSKVLEISGTVSKISDDFNHQKVILIKEPSDKAGVNAIFTAETNVHVEGVKKGDIITVKGVIRSGASYDEDLEMYENVILEKCDIIKK